MVLRTQKKLLELETVQFWNFRIKLLIRKINDQKKRFCGIPEGPKSPNDVFYIINLDLIKDSNQKKSMIDCVLKGAEEDNENTAGIYFLNYL